MIFGYSYLWNNNRFWLLKIKHNLYNKINLYHMCMVASEMVDIDIIMVRTYPRYRWYWKKLVWYNNKYWVYI